MEKKTPPDHINKARVKNHELSVFALPHEKILIFHLKGVVLRDAHPVSNRHALIIPRRHVASRLDLSHSEREAYSISLWKRSAALIGNLLRMPKRQSNTRYQTMNCLDVVYSVN